MGQFKDVAIRDVMEEINQSYFLPDIQREFVWLKKADERKIEQLFDSILRGYPISSFLFWKLKRSDIETDKEHKEQTNKLNFQLYKFLDKYDEREVHNAKINVEQITSNDLLIVLDGQQRLTSLYIGLKGSRTLRKKRARGENPNAYEEKKLYLNLNHNPQFDNPEDNYDFRFFRADEIPAIDEKNWWFKVGNILELGSVLTYARENNLPSGPAETLEKLRDVFCNQKLISYFEETEKNLDKVLKIFIRVNSGGTPLSYSDLLMSILTANFSTDIRDLMNGFVDSIADEGFSGMGRDQVLKTCLILTESNHVFALRNFSKSNIQKIEDGWQEITEQICAAVKIISEFGYRDRLSSAYIITSLAYYLFKHRGVSDEDKSEMLKFVRLAQIKSYFTTSLDNKLEFVAKAIKANKTFKGVNEELSKNSLAPLAINEEDIDRLSELQYGSPAVLPVLQLLYPYLDYKNSKFHIDHIFPKSRFNSQNILLDQTLIDKANYLYNLQLLQGDENISKRAKDPYEWMGDELKTAEKIREYKLKNFIKDEMNLEWDKLTEFADHRRSEMHSKLKAVLLDS